jgi:hypothetical protein
MGFGDKNDHEQLATLTSVKARGGHEAVLPQNPTVGAVHLGQLSLPSPCKPDGLQGEAEKT